MVKDVGKGWDGLMNGLLGVHRACRVMYGGSRACVNCVMVTDDGMG